MSLEQELLDAAEAFEKTAAELDAKETETKTEAVAPVEKTASELAVEKNAAILKEKTASELSSKKVESLQEELGIDSVLAEKVASVDPSVLEYIKKVSQETVDTMGGDDSREKTASIDEDECPLGSFMSAP